MIYGEEILKIAVSAIVGSLVGLEREIRRKPAGFRTLALICVGATIFTICSYKLGVDVNRDRVAANIITGVGFLGAGVIFRNNGSVSGITTAATIWIAAALGMLIGIGEYSLSVITLAVSLIILYALQYIQTWIDTRFQHREYTINFKGEFNADEFRNRLKEWNLRTHYFKETRVGEQTSFEFDVTGKEVNMNMFNQWLKSESRIYSFVW
jgi:putative Mg2+ transporter-C (MgtC) family protein